MKKVKKKNVKKIKSVKKSRTVKPLKNKLIVKILPGIKKIGSIWTPPKYRQYKKLEKAEVLYIGELGVEYAEVKPGMIIYFDRYCRTDIKVFGNSYFLIHDYEVFGIDE